MFSFSGKFLPESGHMIMFRLAAQMGGTVKWPYNDSECLDADFFKVGDFLDLRTAAGESGAE